MLRVQYNSDARDKSLEKEISSVIRYVIKTEFPSFFNAEVSVSIISSEEMRQLNNQYRNVDRATNVLSFPNDIQNGILGDIVISKEIIEREAIERKKTFLQHLKHLVTHSVLHLMGYDHQTEEEATVMEALETKLLKQMGVPDPYLIVE